MNTRLELVKLHLREISIRKIIKVGLSNLGVEEKLSGYCVACNAVAQSDRVETGLHGEFPAERLIETTLFLPVSGRKGSARESGKTALAAKALDLAAIVKAEESTPPDHLAV